MKKFLLLLVIISILMPIHVHNDECGYNQMIGTGCKYEEIIYSPNDKWSPAG